MIKLDEINPIGIGTYQLDLENKEKTLQALEHSVRKGQKHICIKNSVARYI